MRDHVELLMLSQKEQIRAAHERHPGVRLPDDLKRFMKRNASSPEVERFFKTHRDTTRMV